MIDVELLSLGIKYFAKKAVVGAIEKSINVDDLGFRSEV